MLISTAVKYPRVEKCSYNYLNIPESSFSYFLLHPVRWKWRTIYGYENKHKPRCRQSRHQLTVTPTFLAHYCCWSLNYVELIKSNAVTDEYWSEMLNIPVCSGIWTFGWAAPLGNINPQQCNGRLFLQPYWDFHCCPKSPTFVFLADLNVQRRETQKAVWVNYCLFVQKHSRHLVKHKRTLSPWRNVCWKPYQASSSAAAQLVAVAVLWSSLFIFTSTGRKELQLTIILVTD